MSARAAPQYSATLRAHSAIAVLGAVLLMTGCSKEDSPRATGACAGARVANASEIGVALDGEPEYRGMFGEGDAVTRTVAIRNIGHVSVAVRVLASSCGCLKANLDATVLEPGGEAKFCLSTSAAAGLAAIQTQWAAIGVTSVNATEPTLIERVRLSYRAARDWRVVPGILTGMAPLGTHATFESYVRSTSNTLIHEVLVGECDIPGFSGTAERVADSLWRVTLSGTIASLEEARGVLPIYIQYEHGATVRIPVVLRGVNGGSFDPPALLIDGSSVLREHRATFSVAGVLALKLQGRLVPKCRDLRIEADGAGAFVLTLGLNAPLDYGGSLEVHTSDGNLLGRMPIAVLTSSPRARTTSAALSHLPP